MGASNARPIIATRAGGIATLIDEGMPAVVLPRPAGAGDVAQGIAAFMATPAAVWRARADDYRAVMMERRSWPAIARRYIALAQQVSHTASLPG